MAGHRRRRTKISGQFAWRLIEMLESPAYRVLSLSAHRVLDRLELEIASHGGTDNGRLIVTFNQFVDYGIDRHAIAPALREVIALGFVEVTEKGRAGNAEYRAPSQYRLTYRNTDNSASTDEWRTIETLEQAHATASAARNPRSRRKIPSGGKHTVSVGERHTENGEAPVGGTPTTAKVEKPTLLSISRGGVAGR